MGITQNDGIGNLPNTRTQTRENLIGYWRKGILRSFIVS
jgi:hypothetical protein